MPHQEAVENTGDRDGDMARLGALCQPRQQSASATQGGGQVNRFPPRGEVAVVVLDDQRGCCRNHRQLVEQKQLGRCLEKQADEVVRTHQGHLDGVRHAL